MSFRSAVMMCAAIALAACNVSGIAAEVDPYWLKSWEKAQETRPAAMTSTSRIAPTGEPGTPFVIRGQIFRPDGKTPVADVVVHAYHRDARGFDFGPNDTALPTWRLQGWARTDGQGRFEFQTIRPAPDHLGREAAHVHFTLESREYGRQWAPNLVLADDPLVTDRQRQRSASSGEFGPIRTVESTGGVEYTTVKLRLATKGDF